MVYEHSDCKLLPYSDAFVTLIATIYEILLFNKVDVLREELKVSPLEDWMPDYEGETHYDACKFIERRFTDLILDKSRPICTYYMCAVDADVMPGTSMIRCPALAIPRLTCRFVPGVFHSVQYEIGRHYERQLGII
jgi:hypothetical protein